MADDADGDTADGDTMVGFGFKQTWLACRDPDPAALITALDASDLGPVNWRAGIDLAYLTDDRLALTPALPGAGGHRWLLAVGRGLLLAAAPVAVADLSARLGTEVQLFATHRVGELHRWERAVDGVLARAFTYAGEAGEVRDWRGDPDDTERAIGLPLEVDQDTDLVVGESDVLRMARVWSLDPMALDGQPAPGPLRAVALR